MTETQTLGQMVDNLGQPKPGPAPVKENAAERLIADDQSRREKERQERRKAIKADIARRAELAKELELIALQLKSLDSKADDAAARHAADTGPIQAKLSDATGAARDRLVAALTEANVRLETELDVIGRVRQPLQREHRIKRTQLAECKTSSFLAGGAVASPSLLADLHAAKCRIAAAAARIETARGHLDALHPPLAALRSTPVRPSIEGWGAPGRAPVIDLDTVHSLTQRVRRWTVELTAASQEHAAAMEAMREIERDMIAE